MQTSQLSPAAPPDTAATARLYARAAIGAAAVLASRLLGLVREQIFAFFFGASREYDAFLTAFRIPNLLRDLLAEGALSTAFVAVFSRELHAGGKQRAYAIANGVLASLSGLLVAIIGLGVLFAPSLVSAMAFGFDADKAALTVTLTRLMFPYILFAALSALCMGMLNSQGYYALPQSASSFFNVTSIVVGLLGAFLLAPDYMWHLLATLGFGGGHGQAAVRAATAPGGADVPLVGSPAARAMVGMACGTLCGGLVQWLVQVPLLLRLGWRPTPRIAASDPALKEILRLLGPAVVGAAAVQLSVFVNSNFASMLGDKPISWLSYSFRLLQFPIGVFGVAIMAATLPTLAKQAGPAEGAAFSATLTDALELVLFFTVPAAVYLALAGEPMVRLLFEHGRFGPNDTAACAAAVSAYALGLPGYSALKVVQPALVAKGDARSPMLVTVAGVGASLLLNVVFLFGLGLGHIGLALSTSLLATGNTVTLLALLDRRGQGLSRQRLWQQARRTALAAAGSALALALSQQLFRRAVPLHTAGVAFLELGVTLPLAAASYLLLGHRLQLAAMVRAQAMFRGRMGRVRRRAQ